MTEKLGKNWEFSVAKRSETLELPMSTAALRGSQVVSKWFEPLSRGEDRNAVMKVLNAIGGGPPIVLTSHGTVKGTEQMMTGSGIHADVANLICKKGSRRTEMDTR